MIRESRLQNRHALLHMSCIEQFSGFSDGCGESLPSIDIHSPNTDIDTLTLTQTHTPPAHSIGAIKALANNIINI